MRYFLLLLVCVFIGCENKEKFPLAKDVLENSIKTHDPKNAWSTTSFEAYLQEPRLGNPVRYSEVKLNNKENSFELKRNRDTHVSTHRVKKDGSLITLLDGEIVTDSLQIKKYRLEPSRNTNYQRFYKVMLGLPMSLTSEEVTLTDEVSESFFNKEDCYKLHLVFKESLFSKNWNVYFSKKNNKIVGIEMVFPDEPTKGERLTFDGEYVINNTISIPRMRHWKELNNEYLGSDILIEKE